MARDRGDDDGGSVLSGLIWLATSGGIEWIVALIIKEMDMSMVSLEERMNALESELQTLKNEVRSLSGRRPNPNWYNEVAGSMAEFPEFAEVRQHMREARDTQGNRASVQWFNCCTGEQEGKSSWRALIFLLSGTEVELNGCCVCS